jgi:hypothetical protein
MMEGSGSEQRTTDPDPEDPKTYRSFGSGAVTLLSTLVEIFYLTLKKSQERCEAKNNK